MVISFSVGPVMIADSPARLPLDMVELREKYKIAIREHNESVVPCIIGGEGNDGISNQYFNGV